MNRGALRSAVMDITGRTDKTDLTNTALDLALERLMKAFQWEEIEAEADLSISEGDTSVSLPSTAMKLIEARVIRDTNENSYSLGIWDRVEYLRHYPNASEVTKGLPAIAYEENRTLHFVPPSNDDYTIKVTVTQRPSFSSDSTENPIEGSDESLIAYAASYVFSAVQQFEQGAVWMNKFAACLRSDLNSEAQTRSTPRVLEGFSRRKVRVSADPQHDPFNKDGEYFQYGP